MIDSVYIEIPGEPVAQGRPRFSNHGKHPVAYDPKKSRDWKAYAATLMRQVKPEPFPAECPLQLTVSAYWACPKSEYRKREPRPLRWRTKRPDADNVLKAVKDAGSGVLWVDDSQIAVAVVEKMTASQGEPARVNLAVRTLTDDDVALGLDEWYFDA